MDKIKMGDLWSKYFWRLNYRKWSKIRVSIQIGSKILNYTVCILNSQAPDWKSNPHVPDLPRTAVSVKHCLRVSKISPTFSQVLKTLTWLLNSEFIIEIAGNWLISSEFFSQENTFYDASETMSVGSYHPRMTHWWQRHLFNTISYK